MVKTRKTKYIKRKPFRKTRKSRRRVYRLRGGAQKTVNLYIDDVRLEPSTVKGWDGLHLSEFVANALGVDIVNIIEDAEGNFRGLELNADIPSGRRDITDKIEFTDEEGVLKFPSDMEFVFLTADGVPKKTEVDIV
jgi:hypothetical protein